MWLQAGTQTGLAPSIWSPAVASELTSGLVPPAPPSQRCGLCQNFKQTTLTTRLYKVRTNLYPPHLRKRSDAPGSLTTNTLASKVCVSITERKSAHSVCWKVQYQSGHHAGLVRSSHFLAVELRVSVQGAVKRTGDAESSVGGLLLERHTP